MLCVKYFGSINVVLHISEVQPSHRWRGNLAAVSLDGDIFSVAALFPGTIIKFCIPYSSRRYSQRPLKKLEWPTDTTGGAPSPSVPSGY